MALLIVPALWVLSSFLHAVYGAPYLATQPQPRQAADSCNLDFFEGVIPAGTTVERVQHVTTGSFQENGNIGYPAAASGLPSLCVVVINNRTSNFRFGLFLPDVWNSKLLVVGSYSFLGGINWLDMGAGTKYGGMATLSTDTGHSSGQGDLTWATTEQLRVNWAYQAMEGSIILGKSLIQAYYDQAISYSYYSGCSTGGRQGLKQIQRDPNTFDGALIGAPAWSTKNLMPYISKLATWNLPEHSEKSINDPSLFTRLQNEVLEQCDSLDGVKDNIVSSPSACREQFDITRINCDAASDKTGCWSQAQIETAQNMYSDYITDDGEFVYKGLDYSSEGEWGTFLFPADPASSSNVRRNFDAQYERTFVGYGSNWEITSYNDTVVLDARTRDQNSVHASADQYDLGSFRNTGKILLYAGLADATVPVQQTTLYYNRTVEAMGGNIDDFFRYFQIPGMAHCWGTPDNVKAPWMIAGAGQAAQRPPYGAGFSVPGYNDIEHDALLALMDWVENGNAVSQIVATEFNFTDATLQNIVTYRRRPICMFPQKATWDGNSQDDASSWHCT